MKVIKKRIAVGGISTECSTYSSLYQNKNDFESLKNKKLINLINFPFENHNIKVFPIFFNRSVPGGPIKKSYFLQTLNKFLNQLKKINSLDGVLLIMHGAIYVSGIKDPEGRWISSVRKIVGKNCIISASFDLHGQITNKIIKNIDAFASFKTAPHIDVSKTYKRACKMLVNALKKNFRPKVVWSPIPILVSGEMSSTYVEPCKSLYSALDKFNKIKGIIDSNLMIGYVWADTERATGSAIVTCNDKFKGAQVCREIANLYWKSRNKLNFNMKSGNIKSAIKWLPKSFTIMADSGDNPTAGGVGDRADILKEILKKNIKRVLFAGIVSEKAYFQLKKQNEFVIGGALGGGGPSLKLVSDCVYFKNYCAVVTIKHIKIIISKYRRPFHYLTDFENLKINLNDYRLLVVKSGYLSFDLNNLSANTFMVLSDGAVNQNILKIKNKNRRVPTFPFQKFHKFVPRVSDGSQKL